MEDYKVNVIREIREVFTVTTDNKICGYECTEETAQFLRENSDSIISYTRQLYYKQEREKRQGALFEINS